MITVLVSSCLVGNPVRYNGVDVPCPSSILDAWKAENRIVPVCPEVAGGLPIPRPPAEIQGGTGADVLRGTASVADIAGNLVTDSFVAGAEAALALARRHNARLAVLKEKSPSCGSSLIYDGTFSGKAFPGQGVTTALLEANGIRVFSDLQLEAAAAYLHQLEEQSQTNPPQIEV
ncbi:MAG: DUF523 domain-containing protein [Blastocatellia bacterium]|nr:DUF523 domain-containing protein [Blastocatellia bacterium]